ncbi:MAG TPA: peptidase U32 family protein, partial [Exilispira sp.]|nr:peptidase U32 family protein [Exilispira sp.]
MPILKKPELYSPGGSLDKSIKAFSFGADAVYYGLNKFGLRKIKSDNEFDDLQKLLSYANANNKKVDITLNSFLKNNDLNQYFDYFKKMLELEVDGIIVSDPAAVLFYNKVRSKNKLEKTILILSTQTNLTNYSSVHFWYNQGVKRFVLARELSLVEIYEIKKYLIRKKLDAEIETFIHGAMCVSISGRCLLS